MTHGIGLPPILALGSDELKQRVAPPVLAGDRIIALGITEAGGGSDVANLKTTAVRDGDDYVVNGGKMFLTSGRQEERREGKECVSPGRYRQSAYTYKQKPGKQCTQYII